MWPCLRLILICRCDARGCARAKSDRRIPLRPPLHRFAKDRESGAAVGLINEGTQDRRNFKTDASGFYQILNLQPATYRLKAPKPRIQAFCTHRKHARLVQPGGAESTYAVEVARWPAWRSAPPRPARAANVVRSEQVVDERKVRDLH